MTYMSIGTSDPKRVHADTLCAIGWPRGCFKWNFQLGFIERDCIAVSQCPNNLAAGLHFLGWVPEN